MSKEEAELYLRKRLPKLKIAFALFVLFGIIDFIYTWIVRDFAGTLFISVIVIPVGFMLAIYALLLDIKYDEIVKNPDGVV